MGVTPEMLKSKMTEGERNRLERELERSPLELQQAYHSSPLAEILPEAFLRFTLAPGVYGIKTQRVGQLLFRRNDPLLSQFV